MKKGDTVALVCPENHEFVLSFLGASVGGFVPVPIFPGAQDVLKSTAESTTTVTYVVAAAPADLSAFYQRTLGQAGFHEVDGTFVRPGEEIQVLGQGEADGGTLFISVIQHRSARAPDGGHR